MWPQYQLIIWKKNLLNKQNKYLAVNCWKMQTSKKINICKELLPSNYLSMASEAQNARESALKELLEKRKLPAEGWQEIMIEQLINRFAAMDSNNFLNNLGFGEREARIICPLVARRHYHFGHGIGRSGNLSEAQPKAAGSTLMSNLTNALLLDLFQSISLKSCQSCLLVPMATGMTLMLCMLTFKKKRPAAKYVLWSRIDQKSCFKSITSAGLIPIIIETQKRPDTDSPYCTDTKAFECKIKQLGAKNIVCIFSTTSCFAPRNFDCVYELAMLAAKYDIPHLVNNAYGLQCKSIVNYLEYAMHMGRVDLFVQSTDKNLMVPVGGAIIAGDNKETVRSVAQMYAGRASSSQTLDVLMTLLSLGKNGYKRLMEQRAENFKELFSKLKTFAEDNETKLYTTSWNDISIALSLKHLKTRNRHLTAFGSMLYRRGVSGARVVVSGDKKIIDGYEFENWGAHNSSFRGAYLTVAAAIGMERSDIPKLIGKLKACTVSYLKDQAEKATPADSMDVS